MKSLYNKSQLWFSITFIIIYIVGTIIFDNIALILNLPNFLTMLFYIALCVFLLVFIFKNKLNINYGLCSSPYKSKHFLFFIPLFVLISVNLWFGAQITTNFIDSLIFIVSMFCVGFLEEIIFRGFLFKALEKDTGIKPAIIISSLTFGFGHIINLLTFNADILPTLLQIGYATTTGFLFVIIFYKGKTLLPCIFTHSIFNALSLFLIEVNKTVDIITAVIIMVLTLTYALILIKTLPKEIETNE